MTARPILLRCSALRRSTGAKQCDARLPLGICVCTWLAASAAAWLLIWGLWEMVW